jgi:uncharacterized protein (TIGR04255 family)
MTKQKVTFDNAPVIEVVIGAQFDGKVFNYKNIFDYYNQKKDEFTKIEANPPLPSTLENFESQSITKILSGFNSRYFFINDANNKLIQLQPDRLLYNWRKTENKIEYPHFDSVYGEFKKVLNELEGLYNIKEKINQLEVTYFDHIYIDDLGMKDYELDKIFNFWNFGKSLKNFENRLTIPQPEINGNLNFMFQSGTKKDDKKKLIATEMTCRGIITKEQTLDEWYNKSHDILLDFFLELTTDEIQQKWGINK